MIGYVTLGTNDLDRGARFYDALAAELGTGRMMEGDGFIAWGTPDGGAGIGLTKPFDGNAASVGNGTMVALEAKDEAQVQRLHEIALANARQRFLRRLFPRSRRQQAQCLSDAGDRNGGVRAGRLYSSPVRGGGPAAGWWRGLSCGVAASGERGSACPRFTGELISGGGPPPPPPSAAVPLPVPGRIWAFRFRRFSRNAAASRASLFCLLMSLLDTLAAQRP